MEEAAAPAVIRVAALCGSLRKASFNRGLLRSAIQISKEEEEMKGMSIEYVEIDSLPFINTDLEVNGTYPPAVEAFRQKILHADSILFASPEYNYSVTRNIEHGELANPSRMNGDLHLLTDNNMLDISASTPLQAPLKNAIDWASRPPNVWADKPAAIVTTAGGSEGRRSQFHLRQIGVFLDLHFINKPEFFLNGFQPAKKFDSDGNLIDPEAKARLKQVLLALHAFTLRLNHGKC